MKYKVCINAGHAPNGNPDAGACHHGLRESDITFSVGQAVVEELVKRKYSVTFVQDDSLQKVCDVANGVQANLFVSLHCNAFGNEKVYGTEVYVYNKTSRAYEAAKRVCEGISEALNTINRQVREGKNLYVLKHTAMPAMLVEMFFISNEDDVRRFKNGLSGLVTAICDGVDFYFS